MLTKCDTGDRVKSSASDDKERHGERCGQAGGCAARATRMSSSPSSFHETLFRFRFRRGCGCAPPPTAPPPPPAAEAGGPGGPDPTLPTPPATPPVPSLALVFPPRSGPVRPEEDAAAADGSRSSEAAQRLP